MYLLAIDVGNTNIVCGVFEKTKKAYHPKKYFRLVTPETTTTDALAFNVINLLKQNKINKKSITSAIFCSVVPSLNHNITKMMNLYFSINILQVSNTIFTDFNIHYNKREDLGTDRLINLKAGTTLLPLPQIVIDLGTATTIDVVDEKKNYLGGMIIPGIAIALNALVEKTSTLPKIELSFPKTLLGNSTKECMQNGIFFTNSLALQKITLEVIKKYFVGKEVSIILTGGLANFIATNWPRKVNIVSQLTLKGLKIIMDEII